MNFHSNGFAIQPTRMYRGMNEYEIGIAGLQPFHGARTAMGRATVDDPKDALCRCIGWLAYHVVNKTIKGGDAASASALFCKCKFRADRLAWAFKVADTLLKPVGSVKD